MATRVTDRVTLRNIAAIAGVAPSTVYRALAGKEGVSPETRERIAQLAQQMGVQPGADHLASTGAADLDSSASAWAAPGRVGYSREGGSPVLSITLIVDSRNNPFLRDLSYNPFYLELIAGLSEAAQSLGYRLSVEMVSADADLVAVLQHVVPEVDWGRSTPGKVMVTDRRRARPRVFGRGLVWLGYQPRDAYLPWLPMLARVGLPTILCDHYVEGLPCDAVVSDNIEGARALATHVAGLGHRRICILRQALPSVAARERTLGFQTALHDAGLPLDGIHIIEASPTFEGGYDALPQALESQATAILCGNDMMAMGVLRRAAEMGVKVPDALSVGGFDDIATSARLTPALTTVRVDQRAIGREALRRLWTLSHLMRIGTGAAVESTKAAASTERAGGIRIVVPTQLIVRETTRGAV